MGGKKEKLGIIQTCTYLTINAKGDNSYGNIENCFNIKDIVEIWAENYQCFALDINGNLYSWGLNDYGQLGNGQADNYIFPKEEFKYSFVNNLSIINLSKGMISTKLFRDQNPLYLKYIKKISCGDGFTMCLDRDGVVYSWGKNSKGQLGFELQYKDATIITGTKCQLNPQVITSFTERNIHITDIICGSDFSFAIDKNNSAWSWGNNNHSQLARETEKIIEFTPEMSDGVNSFESFTNLCCGWMHGALLTSKNEVYMWGGPLYDYNNNFPDLKIPTKIELPFPAIELTTGFHHFCAIVHEEINNKYELYSWGANEYGQCGHKSDNENKVILFPKKVDFGDNTEILQAVCGSFHTICQMSGPEQRILAFGHNFNKELGEYSAERIDRPVSIGWNLKDKEEYKIKKIICANGFNLIVQVPKDSEIFYDNRDHINNEKYHTIKTKHNRVNTLDNKLVLQTELEVKNDKDDKN